MSVRHLPWRQAHGGWGCHKWWTFLVVWLPEVVVEVAAMELVREAAIALDICQQPSQK